MLRIDMFGFGLGWIDDLGRERAQTYTYFFWAENIPIFVFFFFLGSGGARPLWMNVKSI